MKIAERRRYVLQQILGINRIGGGGKYLSSLEEVKQIVLHSWLRGSGIKLVDGITIFFHRQGKKYLLNQFFRVFWYIQ